MPLFRRLPKRGFSHASWDKTYHVVNVGELNTFEDGATVDADTLRAKGLPNGPADGVRILGNGELPRKLVVKAHHFSKSASQKITDKGGTTELVPQPNERGRERLASEAFRPAAATDLWRARTAAPDFAMHAQAALAGLVCIEAANAEEEALEAEFVRSGHDRSA